MPKLFGWRCLIKCVFFSCIVPESVGFVSSSVCACVTLGGGRGRGFWGYVKGPLIKISRTVPWRETYRGKNINDWLRQRKRRGGGGILPYISYQVFAVPSGRVFAPFWFENGYTLCPFWSGIGYGFRGNYGSVWTYLPFQFQMSKEEREICEFENRTEFEEFLCWHSNLSNTNIISA